MTVIDGKRVLMMTVEEYLEFKQKTGEIRNVYD